MTGRSPVRRCGARTRAGTPCRLPAGQGTDHVGYGRCKLHGGRAPSGRKAAANEELVSFMGASSTLLDVDPIEALLYCVRRASAVAAWARGKAATVEEAEELVAGALNPWGQIEAESIDRLARYSKMALDSGVAERQVRIAERAGAVIAQAIEDALAEVQLTPAERARVARAVATRLAVLEQSDPETLESAA